jgi:hypothetical protein
MTERATKRNPRRSNQNAPSSKCAPTYSIRELHELLDLVIEMGGHRDVENFIEQWLCKSGESGMQLIG